MGLMPCGSKSHSTGVGLSDAAHGRDQLLISFATALSNWRRENHIPLKQIASELGISISTVSSWELGERFPGGFNLEMLVEYTGLPPCKLFCVMAGKCVPADCLLAMSRLSAQEHVPREETNGQQKPMVACG